MNHEHLLISLSGCRKHIIESNESLLIIFLLREIYIVYNEKGGVYMTRMMFIVKLVVSAVIAATASAIFVGIKNR